MQIERLKINKHLFLVLSLRRYIPSKQTSTSWLILYEVLLANNEHSLKIYITNNKISFMALAKYSSNNS